MKLDWFSMILDWCQTDTNFINTDTDTINIASNSSQDLWFLQWLVTLNSHEQFGCKALISYQKHTLLIFLLARRCLNFLVPPTYSHFHKNVNYTHGRWNHGFHSYLPYHSRSSSWIDSRMLMPTELMWSPTCLIQHD
jgi:hypothetical protein